MVSHPEVVRRLREFVCVRLDHEQMQRHKTHLKIPTQGNQILLDPRGKYVPGIEPRGKRYPVETFLGLLDRVLREYPPKADTKDDLRLAWFWWNPADQGLPPYFGPEPIARLDRKPLLTVSGPAPDWLDRPDFLRRHLRQFIWTRKGSGPPRLTVRMLEPERKELLTLDLAKVTPEEAGRALDRAWLAYMKERPLVARGYYENPYGNWLRPVMERAHREELRVREEAEQGTLAPPGRDPPGR